MALAQQPPREPMGYTEDGTPVYVARSWYRYIAQDLWTRVGGFDAPSNSELQINEDDDAGIDGLTMGLYRARDEFNQLPPTVILPESNASADLAPPNYPQLPAQDSLEMQIASLHAENAALKQAINDLNQSLLPLLSEIATLRQAVNDLNQGTLL